MLQKQIFTPNHTFEDQNPDSVLETPHVSTKTLKCSVSVAQTHHKAMGIVKPKNFGPITEWESPVRANTTSFY